MAKKFQDESEKIREFLRKVCSDLDAIVKGTKQSTDAKAAMRLARDVRACVIDGGSVPRPPAGSMARTVLIVTGALVPPVALVGVGVRTVCRKAVTSTKVRDAGAALLEKATHNKRKLALTIGAATLAGVTVGLTGGTVLLAVPIVLAAPMASTAMRSRYQRFRLWVRNIRAKEDPLKQVTARRYKIQHTVLGPVHVALRRMMSEHQKYCAQTKISGSQSCGEWIKILTALYRAADAADKAQPGMDEVLEFYFDLIQELDKCTKKFEDELPACMDAIANRVHDATHTDCVLSGRWYTPLSTTRKKSHGVCYQWGEWDGIAHRRGPRAPKHSVGEIGKWEKDLSQPDGESLLMLKLFNDVANWGGLMSGYQAGKVAKTRTVRALGGSETDKKRAIVERWLPGFFETSGQYKFVRLSADSKETLRSTTIGGAFSSQRKSPGTLAVRDLVREAVLEPAKKGSAAVALGHAFTTVLSSAPAIVSYAATAVDIASDYLNRRLNRASFKTGRRLKWSERMHAMIPGTKLPEATGERLSVAEFLDLEHEALNDAFSQIGDAWKNFRKAHQEFMDLPKGKYENCVSAFDAAAIILRHRITFYELVRRSAVLHEYVHTVGMTYINIANDLVLDEERILLQIKKSLNRHTSTLNAQEEQTVLCPGFCYAPLSKNVIEAIDEIAWGHGQEGDPARPIGGNYRLVSR